MRSLLLQRIAADYEALFTPLYRAFENESGKENWPAEKFQQYLKPDVQKQITWAKRVLKKSDRVTWWLRWYRLAIAKRRLPSFFEREVAKLPPAAREWGESDEFPDYTLGMWEQWAEQLEHLFALPAPKIASFQPGWTPISSEAPDGGVIEQLERLETEWTSEQDSLLSPQPGDEIVIDCGGGLAWWLLDRSQCPAEGKAMGHCGNAASTNPDERMLSLRAKKGDQWEPHATFILRPDGFLGEMKGKENKKPVAKYYPAIVKLLESDIVKGISGGGHAPEMNFSLNDLPEEERERLEKAKPDLMPTRDYYKAHGMDRVLLNRIMTYFQRFNENPVWNPYDQMFDVKRFENLQAAVQEMGTEESAQALRILTGKERPPAPKGGIVGITLAGTADRLSEQQRLKIAAILMHDHEELAVWRDREQVSGSMLCEMARHVDDKRFMESLERARDDGYYAGAFKSIAEGFEQQLKDVQLWKVDTRKGLLESPLVMQAGVPVVFRLMDLGQSFESQNKKLDFYKTDLQGFDDAAVQKSFDEHYNTEARYQQAVEERSMKTSHLRSKFLTRIAADYESMFTSLWPSVPEKRLAAVQARVKQEIAWAKRVLKKADRIVWWLRWLRLHYDHVFLPIEEANKRVNQYMAKAGETIPIKELPHSDWSGYHQQFEHFMSLNVPAIQSWQPGYVSFDRALRQLSFYEEEWKKETKNQLEIKDGDEMVIDFGNGLAWWKLDRHACQEEGDAMGHCGNMSSSDETERILSLRASKPGGLWEPHATFILENDGYLGQMKGKGNEKPIPKYYPYIVKLLEQDWIKGIHGGGHLPENNFSVRDLPKDQMMELIKKKPTLFTLSDRIAVEGKTTETIGLLLDYCREYVRANTVWSEQHNCFLFREWNSWQDVVETLGDEGAVWAMNVINGDQDISDDVPSREREVEAFNKLPSAVCDKIGRLLVKEHGNVVKQFLEDEGYDPEEYSVDTQDADEVVKFARAVDDDKLLHALSASYDDALRDSTIQAIIKSLQDSIEYEGIFPMGDRGFFNSSFGFSATFEKVARLANKLGPDPSSNFDIDMDETLYDMTGMAEKGQNETITMSDDPSVYSNITSKGVLEAFNSHYDVNQEYDKVFGEGAASQYDKEHERKTGSLVRHTRLSEAAV